MSGIGEATALLGALQIGFSIATVLTTYIADVREAKDEVRSLASELDSTLRHLEELDKLVDQNKQTKGWNKNGEALVENCKQDSVKIVNQLVELLGNSGANVSISTEKTFKREDIDLTIFHKAQWPLFKPQVEIVKRELQTIKISILLARDVYKASAGATLAEKEGARQRLAGLSRGKVEALKQLRQAKRKVSRSTRNARGLRFEEPGEGPSSGRRSDSDSESGASSNTYSYHSVHSSLYSDIRAEIEQEYLERKERDERETKRKEEETARLKAAAVADYKKTLLDAIAKSKQDAADLTQQLESNFEAVPKAQIQQYVQSQQQAQIKDEELKQLSERFQFMTAASSSTQESSNGGSEAGFKTKSVNRKPSRLALWSSSKSSLPSALLRQEAYPDCARLLSIVIKLDSAAPVVDPFHVSMPWLIEHMKKEERESIKEMGATSQTVKTWAGMPPQCRVLANDWLGQNTLHAASWSLVFARNNVSKSSTRRRLLHRMLGDAPVVETLLSVLLVYRHSRLLEDVIRPVAPSGAPTVVEDTTTKSETVPVAAEPNSNAGILKNSLADAKYNILPSDSYRPSSSLPGLANVAPNSYTPYRTYGQSVAVGEPLFGGTFDNYPQTSTIPPTIPPAIPPVQNDYTVYNTSIPRPPNVTYPTYYPTDPYLPGNPLGPLGPNGYPLDKKPSYLNDPILDRYDSFSRRENSRSRARPSYIHSYSAPRRRSSMTEWSDVDVHSRLGDDYLSRRPPREYRHYGSSSGDDFGGTLGLTGDNPYSDIRSKSSSYTRPRSLGRRSSPAPSDRIRSRDSVAKGTIGRPLVVDRFGARGSKAAGEERTKPVFEVLDAFSVRSNDRSTIRARSRERANEDRRFVLYSKPDTTREEPEITITTTTTSRTRSRRTEKATDDSLSAEVLSKYGNDATAGTVTAPALFGNGTIPPPVRITRSTSQTSPTRDLPAEIPLDLDERVRSSIDSTDSMDLYD